MPGTVLCTSCGINPVPAPDSIEIDPICAECEKEQDEAQRGVTFFATYRQSSDCPGYNLEPDEDCGGPKMKGSDLCGDCHMARLEVESPRLQR